MCALASMNPFACFPMDPACVIIFYQVGYIPVVVFINVNLDAWNLDEENIFIFLRILSIACKIRSHSDPIISVYAATGGEISENEGTSDDSQDGFPPLERNMNHLNFQESEDESE